MRSENAACCPFDVAVICTVLNDADGAKIALDSLAAQTLPATEIIVVDGGSNPQQRARLAAVVRDIPRLRIIDAPGANIAQGRNIAIRHARCDLIACIDAGCRAEPEWLERITRPFANSLVGVVGGFYRVKAASRLQKLVGRLTMPIAVEDVDPARFNPSARSLAFRRETWLRAGGFPEWLQTAEDTLFDLKLRLLRPRVGYAFAPDAVVEWSPRSSWMGIFRQFAGYARGEAHIGREGPDMRYHRLRAVNLLVWSIVAGLLLGERMPLAAALAMLIVVAVLIRPHGRSFLRIAMAHPDNRPPDRQPAPRSKSPPLSNEGPAAWRRLADVMTGLLVAEWIVWARMTGWTLGRRDRRRRPEYFDRRLALYLRATDADLAWESESLDSRRITPWQTVDDACPGGRTLIIAWHWPPTNRASANVLGNLFRHASPRNYRVLTRAVGHEQAEPDDISLAADRVRWPLPDDRPVRFRTLAADLATTVRIVWRAWRVHLEWNVQGVLAVYPTRYGLLSGWMVSKLLGVPLIAYMHDLFRETLLSGSRLKRAAWSRLDDRILRDARLILTPTPHAARHYAARGLHQTFVLPHTMPDVRDDHAAGSTRSSTHEAASGSSEVLKLAYAGAVYEAHHDAVEALIAAVRNDSDVSLVFFSRSQGLPDGCDVRWLSPADLARAVRKADMGVVALGWNTPYPEEIHVCFPSKIIDYLAAGRPILAIVPQDCFVDAFVRETGCGVVVNSKDPDLIRTALAALRDPGYRRRLAAAVPAAAARLDAKTWMSALTRRLSNTIVVQASCLPYHHSRRRHRAHTTIVVGNALRSL